MWALIYSKSALKESVDGLHLSLCEYVKTGLEGKQYEIQCFIKHKVTVLSITEKKYLIFLEKNMFCHRMLHSGFIDVNKY